MSINATTVPVGPPIMTGKTTDIERKVDAQFIIWIRITEGWNVKPNQVLTVYKDGSFVWTQMKEKNETKTITGRASIESITQLRNSLKTASAGILVDDGGIMQAQWLDNKSIEHKAEYDIFDDNPGAVLRTNIKNFIDSQH